MATRVETRLSARDETKQAFRSMQRSLDGVNSAFVNVTKVAAGLGAIFSGVFVTNLVQVNSRFQALEASLITFTGSVENARGAFNVLKEFAKTTPFSLQEVVASFNILIAQGIRPTEAQLAAFADIAGGTSKSIMQFAEAVADASVGEFERLKEFGIKAGKEGDKITLTFGGQTKTINNDADSILAALTEIGATKFAGGAARQADTLGGAITNLRDTTDEFLFSIGDAGFNGALKDAITIMKNALSGNNDLAKSISDKLTYSLHLLTATVRLVVDNLDNLLIAMGVVFSLSAMRKVLNMGKAMLSFGRTVAKSQLAMTMFSAVQKMLTDAMGKGKLALVKAAAGMAGLAIAVKAGIDALNEHIDVTELVGDTFRALGIDGASLERQFNEMTGANADLGESFLHNNGTISDFLPTIGDADKATKKLTVSNSDLETALKNVTARIDPTGTALRGLTAETAALQIMLKSGKISAQVYKEVLNETAREALGLDTRTAELAKQQSNATAAFNLGIISGEEYKDVMLDNAVASANLRSENEATFGSGAIAGVLTYYQKIEDAAGNMKDFVGNAFDSMETTLSDFFMTGKLDFGSFTNVIKRGLADLAAKALITTGINFLGKIFPSLQFADGGIVPGSGGPKADNVLARVSSGEYVVQASSVSKFGKGFFDQLNGGRMPVGNMGVDAGIIDDMTEGFGFGGLFKPIRRIIKKIISPIRRAINGVIRAITDTIGYISDAIKGLVEGIMSGDLATIAMLAGAFILPGLGPAIMANMGAGMGFAASVSGGMSTAFASGILGAGSLSTIATQIGIELAKGTFASKLGDTIAGSITGITDNMGQAGGSLEQDNSARFGKLYNEAAPYLAGMTGTAARRGDNVRVGERGPELFIPQTSGAVSPIKGTASDLIGAVHEMRDEIVSLRRTLGRALAGGQLAGARV